jgi:ketosteroid isomerase-like protein
MGQAREVMDRVTDAIVRKDLETARELYAPDAVAETPDQGTLRGRDAIIGYMSEFVVAMPDLSWESYREHESGNDAIDEGFIVGTNTGPLPMPGGESLPATGRSIRVQECDAITVEDGLVTSHRFYFDQMELLAQLGLAPTTEGQPPG